MFNGMWMLLVAGGVVMLAMLVWADNEGSHAAMPEAAPERSRPKRHTRVDPGYLVQPVKVRRGSPEAPAQRTFALGIDRNGMVLTGPSELAVNDLVYLEADRPRGAQVATMSARVVGHTDDGHAAVRFSA